MSNQSRKSLPLPYELSLLQSKGVYYFTTDRNITYTCGFSNITPKLSPVLGMYDMEVYDFELYAYDPQPEIRKPKDQRVSATVIDMMQNFFVNPSRILTYVCDSGDGRAKERQALFRQWHSNLADTINRDEVIIEVESSPTIYGCILSRKDFPHMDVLKTELADPVRGFVAQKFEG